MRCDCGFYCCGILQAIANRARRLFSIVALGAICEGFLTAFDISFNDGAIVSPNRAPAAFIRRIVYRPALSG
jgi:hypothetical protein